MSVEGGKMHKGISKPGVVTASFLRCLLMIRYFEIGAYHN